MDIKQEITKIESLFHLITNINQTIVEEGKISHLEKELIKDYLKKVLLKYQEIAQFSGVASETTEDQEKVVDNSQKEKNWQDLKSEFAEKIDSKYAPFTNIEPEINKIQVNLEEESVETNTISSVKEVSSADNLLETIKAQKEENSKQEKKEEPIETIKEDELSKKAIEFLEDDEKIEEIMDTVKEIKLENKKKVNIPVDEDEFKPTMNDIFMEKIGKEKNLNSNSGKLLKDSIMLNDRIIFIKELFAGNIEEFTEALSKIDNSPTLEEAFSYLESNIVNKNGWSIKEKVSNQFYALVKKKFGIN
ncbi:MAG: hypothetical protein IPN93_15720 [Bacteroidetes bacterium]|jgi:hypothetical protein|nr:hypothetical protein [Bacteroidota bacterium]MBK7640928.1 hypothetical protein [Bacteroidota bacterium]MBK8674367.1 hypothetical protein [Bacteroidota bacterium]MBK9355418.1 hypothetical protein [Bacteroidota bacterium]MBL0287686.1 hypothetical protein [Bacteroidota bacterium]